MKDDLFENNFEVDPDGIVEDIDVGEIEEQAKTASFGSETALPGISTRNWAIWMTRWASHTTISAWRLWLTGMNMETSLPWM